MRTWSFATVVSMCLAHGSTLHGQPAPAVALGEILGREGVVRVVRDERTIYFKAFTAMTTVEPVVAPDVDDRLTARIAPIVVTAATPAAAEAMLRVRFRGFLGNFTAFSLATTQKVTLDEPSVARYLEAAGRAGRCGEFPCQSGCADGRPCDRRCNPCQPK